MRSQRTAAFPNPPMRSRRTAAFANPDPSPANGCVPESTDPSPANGFSPESRASPANGCSPIPMPADAFPANGLRCGPLDLQFCSREIRRRCAHLGLRRRLHSSAGRRSMTERDHRLSRKVGRSRCQRLRSRMILSNNSIIGYAFLDHSSFQHGCCADRLVPMPWCSRGRYEKL